MAALAPSHPSSESGLGEATVAPCCSGQGENLEVSHRLFPTVSINSWNATSLSLYPQDVAGKVRQGAVSTNLGRLCSSAPINCIQETKCNSCEGDFGQGAISRLVKDCKVFYSNDRRGSAGVATLVKTSFLEKHDTEVVKLAPILRGHALAIKFVPKDNSHKPFTVFNIYLSSKDPRTRKRQLKALMLIAPPEYSFWVGDWNFVTLPEDSSATTFKDQPTNFLQKWADFTAHFSLREVRQPLHTYYHICKDASLNTTKRLDRIYTSLSETDLAVSPASATAVFLPHSVITRLGRVDGTGTSSASLAVSDHIAVGLRFEQPKGGGGRPPRIPRWLAEEPLFIERLRAILPDYIDDNDSPFDQHSSFIAAAFEAKRDFYQMAKVRAEVELSRMARFSACVKTLKLLCAETPDEAALEDVITANPFIHELVVRAEEGTEISELRSYANELINQEAATSRDDRSKHRYTPSSAGFNVLKSIKTFLPSDRVRLTGLRKTLDDEIAQEPQAMAEIAKGYWSGVWEKRPKHSSATKRYLRGYKKQIAGDPRKTIRKLNRADRAIRFQEIINNSNNSCAGPDGIPFAVYRAAFECYSFIAAGIFNALAEGATPPNGYNDGLLFLLPKKGFLTPDDTRPLSVTNSYNRLIASMVVADITPTMQAFLEPNQKGFIPGRKGEDHIRDLNERFYGAADPRAGLPNYHVLFVDTKKAFDSIDHDYIITLLLKIGLPSWLVTIVKALLSNVKVNPILGGSSDVWIDIHRGVKQGCPLSPLLFAIAYDPLLCELSRIDGLDTFAFADDMALGSERFAAINRAMGLIDAFREASGLGVNTDKTTLLSAQGRLCDTAALAERSTWPDVLVVNSHVYLGILIGRGITIEDIYAGALRKLEARARAYHSAARCLPHASRVLVFNTFLFTKLSYIMNFYSLPFGEGGLSAVVVLERVAKRLVINFNNAYIYQHLIEPPDRFGPSPPLRDGWITSVATLAAKADPQPFDGVTWVEEIKGAKNSLSMKVHIKASLNDFISWHLRGCIVQGTRRIFLAKDFFKESEAATRLALTKRLLRVAHADDQDAHTAKVLKRRHLPCDLYTVDCLHEHYAILPPKLSKFRKNQFLLTFNALATGTRRMVIHYPDAATRHAQPLPPCPFCFRTGREGQGGDDVAHFYSGRCPVVVEARLRFGSLIGVDISPDALLLLHDHANCCPGAGVGSVGPCEVPVLHQEFDKAACCGLVSRSTPVCKEASCRNFGSDERKFKISSYLAFGPVSPATTTALVSFNSSVWTDRCNFFVTRSELDEEEGFDPAIRLARVAALSYLGATSSTPKGFGKAGTRTAKQTARAHAYAVERVANIPIGDAMAFTDGASRGNPGVAGSGTSLSVKGSELDNINHFVALGEATNNFAELWAIGVALSLLRRLPERGYPYNLHILTDSEYSIGCLEGGFSTKTNFLLVRAIRRLKQRLIADGILGNLSFIWVPGHAGLEGNELADSIANQGADDSAAGATCDTGSAIEAAVFVPD